MSRGYKLSEGSVRSINATIRTVNQMRKTGIAGDLPFRQNARKGGGGRQSPAYFQFGKTAADWDINEYATITRYKLLADGSLTPYRDKNGNEVTFRAFNMFANVKAEKMVGCCFQGEVFSTDPDNQEILILVAAECD